MKKRLQQGAVVLAFVVATLMAPIMGGSAWAFVGGQDAHNPGPHAAVWINGKYRCTGSVVGNRTWVLTSGDCAALAQTAPTQVVVGVLGLDGCTTLGKGCERVDVVGAFYDPNYTGETPAYDVGLLKLAKPVHVNPARIDPAFDRVGASGIAAGWGYTCQDPTVTTCNMPAATLQQLRMTMVDSSRCDLGTLPSGAPVVDPRFVACVASSDGSNAMACVGDSGAVLRGTINVGDGDDLGSRPDFCATSPAGGQGTGLATRIGPSYGWIVTTICHGGPTATAPPANTPSLSQQLSRQMAQARWQNTVLVG